MILGAIDIGSNAARLLISETFMYKDGNVDFIKLNLLRIPLRLGFDVFELGYIGDDRRDKFLLTLKAYKTLMDIYGVEHYRACATSAMRDANNGRQIIEKAREETGIEVEIISGKDEANIIFETHIAENLNVNKNYLYVDVGGGSTELTLFSADRLVYKESFNIGTIRLLNNKVSDTQWEQMKTAIKEMVREYAPIEAIGSGGNINKIFSMSKRKDGKPLPLELLKDYYKELSNTTIEERRHLYGFRNDRADVIVPALQIYISVMRWADAQEIYVPKVGLTDGLIRMLYKIHTSKNLQKA